MKKLKVSCKHALGATVLALFLSGPQGAWADDNLSDMLDRLSTVPAEQAQTLAKSIQLEWSKSGSATADALFKLGQDAWGRRDYLLAVDHLDAALGFAPDFVAARYLRAQAYLHAGMTGPALDEIEVLLAKETRHFPSVFLLANVLEMYGQIEQARAAYLKLRAIHPHYPDLDNSLRRISSMLDGQSL